MWCQYNLQKRRTTRGSGVHRPSAGVSDRARAEVRLIPVHQTLYPTQVEDLVTSQLLSSHAGMVVKKGCLLDRHRKCIEAVSSCSDPRNRTFRIHRSWHCGLTRAGAGWVSAVHSCRSKPLMQNLRQACVKWRTRNARGRSRAKVSLTAD